MIASDVQSALRSGKRAVWWTWRVEISGMVFGAARSDLRREELSPEDCATVLHPQEHLLFQRHVRYVSGYVSVRVNKKWRYENKRRSKELKKKEPFDILSVLLSVLDTVVEPDGIDAEQIPLVTHGVSLRTTGFDMAAHVREANTFGTSAYRVLVVTDMRILLVNATREPMVGWWAPLGVVRQIKFRPRLFQADRVVLVMADGSSIAFVLGIASGFFWPVSARRLIGQHKSWREGRG